MKHCYRAGIDIGSTTAKLVILDERGVLCYSDYRRHCAHTQETLAELLEDACAKLGPCDLRLKITGSGSINLGKAMGIGFVQEVVAVASALQAVAPQTDVAIELGGEDAKIIYFRGGLEERMNGVCAGGTGSFIDQMASLLQTDAAGLNAQAEHYQEIYPIAARCGVFAKTDIQPLINEGATTADLAASIFQAVVNQTISGLACGKPIRGCVAFLGGPLHFLPELKKAFIRTLKLTPETTVDPENSHLFAAMGAALESGDAEAVSMDGLIDRLDKGVEMAFELKRLDPLFATREDHQAFCARHSKAVVRRESLPQYRGECFLGIDAGSTTTKVALIGSFAGHLVHDKQIFQVLHMPETQALLTDEENAFVRDTVPFTSFLTSDVVAERNVKATRENWIIKPTDAYGSKDVFAGSNYTDEQWAEIVDAHVDSKAGAPFLVQRYCTPFKTLAIPLYGTEADATVKPLLYNNMEGLYIYNGRFTGVFSRLGPEPVICKKTHGITAATIWVDE